MAKTSDTNETKAAETKVVETGEGAVVETTGVNLGTLDVTARPDPDAPAFVVTKVEPPMRLQLREKAEPLRQVRRTVLAAHDATSRVVEVDAETGEWMLRHHADRYELAPEPTEADTTTDAKEK